jgi:hypothetical protein
MEWISDSHPEHRDCSRQEKFAGSATGVNTSGLSTPPEVATIVQREPHERIFRLPAATELWHFRLGYLNALYYLDGNGSRLAKDVEVSSLDGRPLAIAR